jgi:hypothetical protein
MRNLKMRNLKMRNLTDLWAGAQALNNVEAANTI